MVRLNTNSKPEIDEMNPDSKTGVKTEGLTFKFKNEIS